MSYTPARFTRPTSGKIPNVSVGATTDMNNAWDMLGQVVQVNVLDTQWSGGADPSGSIDATSAIQAALTGTPAGGVCYFPPGTYKVSATLKSPPAITILGPRGLAPLGSYRDDQTVAPAVLFVANGANLDVVLADIAYTTSSTNPVPSSEIQILGMDIDCNSANQTGGAGNAIALITQGSSVVNNRIRSSRGHSILLTDTSLAGHTTTGGTHASLNENNVSGNRIYAPTLNGIYIQSQGSLVTDGYCYDNVVDNNFSGTGVPIVFEKMSGWRVAYNHVYACQGDAYHLYRADNCWIFSNYADNFGQASVTATTYYGFQIQLSPFGTAKITNNHASTKEAAGGAAGNFIYYSIAAQASSQQNNCYFAGNTIRQISSTGGTHTGYKFDAGTSGNLQVNGITSGLLEQNTAGNYVASPVSLANSPTFPDFRSGVTTYSPSNPTGTTSATLVMMGLALAYTPVLTGKLKITVYGGGKNTATATAISVGIREGTGTAPINGVAVTGTTVGKDQPFVVPTTGNPTPFCFVAEATGLTPGTAAWIDLAVSSNGTQTSSLVNLYVTAEEVA
jgi:hypothetical protein